MASISAPARHVAYIPVTGQGNELRVRLAQPGPALCVTSVTVGSIQPDEAAQAIPGRAGRRAGPRR